jgi:hypothetical protein
MTNPSETIRGVGWWFLNRVMIHRRIGHPSVLRHRQRNLQQGDRIPMKKLATLLAVAALVVGAAANAAEYSETGYSTDTILIDSGDTGCGTLVMNADGTYENGYAWRYGGIVPPDYGAFAECYFGPAIVCSGVFDFSTTGTQAGQSMDIYIYCDAGGTPGPVMCVQRVTPGPIAFWPSISRHTFPLTPLCDLCGCDAWWIGYWGNWPGAVQGWFVGADLDGFGGCPYTNIAPGIGFPTGWNNVSIVWGPTQAIGIGAEIKGCDVPVLESTWGAIKALYN